MVSKFDQNSLLFFERIYPLFIKTYLFIRKIPHLFDNYKTIKTHRQFSGVSGGIEEACSSKLKLATPVESEKETVTLIQRNELIEQN